LISGVIRRGNLRAVPRNGSSRAWRGSGNDRSRDHYPRTLLQDRPCHSSPQVLSKVDDQTGRGFALDRRNMYDTVASNQYNKSREWALPQIWCLGKRIHEIRKLSGTFLLCTVPYCSNVCRSSLVKSKSITLVSTF